MTEHLPEGWRIMPLSCAITKIIAGTSVNADDRASRAGEIGVLKVSSVSSGIFLPSQNKAVVASDIKRVSVPVRAKTIIVSRSNTPELVGASVYVTDTISHLYHSDKLWQVYVNERIANTKFLAYVLSLTDVRKRLAQIASGSSKSMKNISQDRFMGLKLPFPSLPEQHRIVEILDEADAAVRLTEALIDAKLKHKRAWAERLLTGKVRFPEFAGEAWQTNFLRQLFTERVEMKRSDLKLLAVTSGDGIVDRDSLAKRDTSNADKSKYLRVAPGDIAYNTMRMWQGVFGLSTQEGIVSPAYTVCTPNHGLIDGSFTAQLFKTPAQIAKFHRYSQGLVSDTLNLKFPAFSKVKVTIPQFEEQRKIAEVLGLMDEEIALRRRQLAALKAQKQGLMQKLLTGEVRVKEPERPIEFLKAQSQYHEPIKI